MEKKYTIVGIDEAGRGPLAGPVVAASIIIDEKLLPNTRLIIEPKDLVKSI